MMQIREYLIGITAAALVCGVVRVLVSEKGAAAAVIRMLLGVLMLLVVIQPVSGMSAEELFDWSDFVSADANAIVSDAENVSKEEIHARIKQETATYILSKAEALGVELEVAVELSDDLIGKPVSLRIKGAASPYAKQQLIRIIEKELGIGREDQQWIG